MNKVAPKNFVIEKFVLRTLARAAGGLLLLAMLAYPIDFAVWRTRLALSHDSSSGLGSVEVTRVVAAELKGNKEDYYFDGTTTVSCSHSIFPQGGVNACWWQQRHREVIMRY
jgi:hypothetical protein